MRSVTPWLICVAVSPAAGIAGPTDRDTTGAASASLSGWADSAERDTVGGALASARSRPISAGGVLAALGSLGGRALGDGTSRVGAALFTAAAEVSAGGIMSAERALGRASASVCTGQPRALKSLAKLRARSGAEWSTRVSAGSRACCGAQALALLDGRKVPVRVAEKVACFPVLFDRRTVARHGRAPEGQLSRVLSTEPDGIPVAEDLFVDLPAVHNQ